MLVCSMESLQPSCVCVIFRVQFFCLYAKKKYSIKCVCVCVSEYDCNDFTWMERARVCRCSIRVIKFFYTLSDSVRFAWLCTDLNSTRCEPKHKFSWTKEYAILCMQLFTVQLLFHCPDSPRAMLSCYLWWSTTLSLSLSSSLACILLSSLEPLLFR